MEPTPIPGFDGYGATPDGRTWSMRWGAWREVKPFSNGKGGGYLKVKLYRDGKAAQVKVHHIMALVFIGPKPDGLVVNHKDGNKLNNTPSNLEYCTYKENSIHAIRSGLRKPRPKKVREPVIKPPRVYAQGESVKGSKLKTEDVLSIRARHAKGESLAALGRAYGVSKNTAWRIVRGMKWAHVV